MILIVNISVMCKYLEDAIPKVKRIQRSLNSIACRVFVSVAVTFTDCTTYPSPPRILFITLRTHIPIYIFKTTAYLKL